jgi:hypothetical protein
VVFRRAIGSCCNRRFFSGIFCRGTSAASFFVLFFVFASGADGDVDGVGVELEFVGSEPGVLFLADAAVDELLVDAASLEDYVSHSVHPVEEDEYGVELEVVSDVLDADDSVGGDVFGVSFEVFCGSFDCF